MSSNLIVNNIEVGAGATIYTAASNQLTFGTNGSEKVRITSAGHIGINASATNNRVEIIQDPLGFPDDSAQPQATILVKHGTSGSNRRWVGIGASLTGAWIQSSSPGGTGLSAPLNINPGGGDVSIPNKLIHYGDTDTLIEFETNQINFDTGGSERLRITSSGVVSINDSTPETWATLQVNNHSTHNAAQVLIRGADQAQIILRDDTGGSNQKCTTIRNDQGVLIFGTHNDAFSAFTERYRITTAGTHVFGGNTAAPIVDNGELLYRGNTTQTFESLPQSFYLYGDTLGSASANTGTGMVFGGKYKTDGSITTFAGIHGIRTTTTNNSYPGALVFGTRTDGGGAWEKMRIDSSGNVTKPKNFHILVQRSGNQTGYNASSLTDPIIWNSVVTGESSTNASSHFNTSTGLFTAPVTGMYHFHASVNCNFNCEGGWIIVNGSRPNYSCFYPNNTQSADGHLTYHITAGETVGIKWYDNGNTNATINANTYHTWWRIVLLG